MADIKPIRTDEDCDAALARIEEIFDSGPGTPEGEELEVLMDLVERYESDMVMEYPDPVEAIKFRMEQAGLKQRDLVPFIGSRAKVSEVLSGKRDLTMKMARALHEHLGIPADVLLQKPGGTFENASGDIQWSRFPLKEMARRKWIPSVSDLDAHAEESVGGMISKAGGWDETCAAALFRKNDHRYVNSKTDSYALKAWCLQVLTVANQNPPPANYKSGTVTLDFLRKVARISQSENGPRLAKEFLEKHGISLVTLGHLSGTYLDGAALRLVDGRPVIGLTLRYDRIDNFWFCLLHELAHLGLHMDKDDGVAFIDDLTLRKVSGMRDDSKETEADRWAEEALIPQSVWETSEARLRPTAMAVINLANSLNIHPAIVAGRVRRERDNYRLLSQFVGNGMIRSQFDFS